MEAKFKIDDAVKFIITVENKYTIGDEGRIDVDGVFERNSLYFYNVKSAGKVITDVPETDIEFVYSSVERNVDEVLRRRDEKRSFKDSDVRVSGSRKEMMAYSGLLKSEDLENIEKDKVIAKKLVNKDKVYPEINTNEQIDKGVGGGTLFLKMKLREFVHKTPPDTAEFRALYVGLCQWLYELFDDAITVSDFEERIELFKNGVIRKSLLISNSEIENELILQNKEYEQEIERLNEYDQNFDVASNKLYELAKKSDIPTWQNEKLQEAFPEVYKEVDYWKKLKQVAQQFKYNKILPLEFRFLHNLAVIDEEGDKMSLLTQKSLPQGEIGKSKQIDDEYVINFSSNVRKELIKSVLGEKLYLFIYKIHSIKSVRDAWEDYEKYEAFTEEQYQKIFESSIKPIEDSIKKYSDHIEYLSDPEKLYKDKLNYALEKAGMGTWRWGKSSYSFEKMIRRGDIDEAIRLMKDIIEKPDSGFHKIINEKNQELKDLKEKYFVRESNYSFLDKEKKERKKGERSELVVNSSEPLSYIKRVGGVAIYDTDLDTQDSLLQFYKNILGIIRITFGLTITDKERKAQAHYFAGSMLDMAEAINWDVKALTSGFSDDSSKSLGIMFAAAGRGKAMAHYQSGTNAINLTRSKGDGSVAHEMMHMIDFCVQRRFPNDRKSEKNHAVYSSFTKNAKNVSNIAIQAAFENVMTFIKRGIVVNKKTLEVSSSVNKENPIFKQIEPLLGEFIQSVSSAVVSIKIDADPKRTVRTKLSTIEETIDNYKHTHPHYFTYSYFSDNTNEVKKLLGAIVNSFGLENYTFQFSNDPKNKKSNYYSDTVDTSTSFFIRSSAMKSDYWSFDWELAARSAECFLQDAMEKQGRSNNYLVSGVNFSHGSGVYPQGVEREILFILFSNLFSVIKQELNIEDFKPFRNDRTDEYVDLPKEDEEENENVLIVDEKTKEIIDGDAELMKQKELAIEKMNKLKELLSKKSSEENFEDGGQINISSGKLIKNLFSFSK